MRTELCTLFFLLLCQFCLGQVDNRIEGPIIYGYGDTWTIDSPDLQADPDQVYHMVFDIYQKPEDPSALNSSINTLARFLNMHAKAGVKMEQIKVVAVIHGSAGNDIMQNEFHEEKYEVVNPNVELITKLDEAGVDFYVCGQTMNARGLDRDLLLPEIKVALSAMTVINKFVTKGYTLIKF